MRWLLKLFGGQAGDLLLVGSLVTALPTWVGSFQLLSTLGVDGAVAALVSGVYIWGRAGVSALVLFRRARSGGLDLLRSNRLPSSPTTVCCGAARDPLACARPASVRSWPDAVVEYDSD